MKKMRLCFAILKPQIQEENTVRLKHIKGAEEAVAASPFVVQEPQLLAGNWSGLFGNAHPVHMEIGMGKGRFLMDLARLNPDISYIGMERYSSVLLRALQKMEEDPLPNLRFLCFDAADLEQIFSAGEIDRIYLNFSDPWPKARHARRRLTSPVYLKRYASVLKPDGHVEFKTDNEALFDYSLESVEEAGWKLLDSTRDLHHDPRLNEGNIMTEYEEKFSSRGNPIFKLIASPV